MIMATVTKTFDFDIGADVAFTASAPQKFRPTVGVVVGRREYQGQPPRYLVEVDDAERDIHVQEEFVAGDLRDA
jgi:hypothetical protein